MTSEERDLITGLFNRLRAADTGSKDQEADQLIGQLTGGQPGAPYRLVQTLLVQEHALSNATVRIQQLEKQVADAKAAGQPSQGGGSFLSGLFGHHPSAPAAPAPQPSQGLPIPPQQLPQQAQQPYVQNPPPYPSTVGMAPSAGGGFLRGALQTAAGVAGGSLIAQGIENLLGHHSGPFGGGGYGGGGGFFGGGGYGGGGGGGIVENTEVINNYYEDHGGSGFAGAAGGDPGFREAQHEDNRGDVERGDGGGGAFTDAGFDSSNPFDAPMTEDLGSTAMDNTFDLDNTDASSGDFGGDSGGGSSGGDDSSLV